ncbi:ATP-dependent DNA helicase [Piscinibacter sakaiensis]|nr:ATP-dependent DNA helicase [Piscinibacter sakaiensis]
MRSTPALDEVAVATRDEGVAADAPADRRGEALASAMPVAEAVAVAVAVPAAGAGSGSGSWAGAGAGAEAEAEAEADADADADAETYLVAVRALCEFSARAGDLDRRFTPSTTALEGQAGHALVAARRGPAYERELALEARHGPLRVRGRADGYDAAANRLEEVKTHRGPAEAIGENRRALHWAQLRAYGAMLCAARGLAALELALVYFDVGSQTETVLREQRSAASLAAEFAERCERFVAWARQELAHRRARDAMLAALPFPHRGFRDGQRPLAEAVYRAVRQRRCLLAQAPTGIGKTLGTLFPALRACADRPLDKLFYLTAKTPGRGLALQALQALRGAARPGARGWPLRVLELVALEKACEHPDRACHGESCPLAAGFYDRLPAARDAALAAAAHGPLDKAALRRVALAQRVCPYHLGQDLVRWADVLVGDYAHYFDASALLHGLRVGDGWRVAVLVDEAHNLVERARAMYSGELRLAQLEAAHAVAPASLRAPIARLARAWARVDEDLDGDDLRLEALPEPLQAALQGLTAALGDHLARQALPEPALLTLHFDALHLGRLAETAPEHALIEALREPAASAPEAAAAAPLFAAAGIATGGRGLRLRVRNVVPAPFLKTRWEVDGCTLFSATLQPDDYHRDLLGLPADTVVLEVGSPFRAEQLQVRLATGVSTRWPDRAASVAPIVALIAQQFAQAPGNYLAFFSSFDYLQQVADALRAAHPGVPVWAQSPAMDEPARDAFLARFADGGQGIGFAVLGGAFGEGIDLPGRRLVGAFVVTLGLPPWNEANERVRSVLEHCFGSAQGHDYTYLYPGLQKVVQAAGRVIRTPDDRGTVWLVDDRYGRAKVRRLLPSWWAPRAG